MLGSEEGRRSDSQVTSFDCGNLVADDDTTVHDHLDIGAGLQVFEGVSCHDQDVGDLA